MIFLSRPCTRGTPRTAPRRSYHDICLPIVHTSSRTASGVQNCVSIIPWKSEKGWRAWPCRVPPRVSLTVLHIYSCIPTRYRSSLEFYEDIILVHILLIYIIIASSLVHLAMLTWAFFEAKQSVRQSCQCQWEKKKEMKMMMMMRARIRKRTNIY